MSSARRPFHLLLRLACRVLAAIAAGAAAAPAALAGDGALCTHAIRRAEVEAGVPRGLLAAVALSESGRRDPDGDGLTPWPWTVNAGGEGRYFASAAEAAAWVERLRGEGRRNIDVGCMQVNLMHHPGAFADLGEAFDPAANVAYAARFLTSLERETGSWPAAVARYHTAEPERGAAYRDRVYAHWDATRLGRTAGSRPGGLLAAGPTRSDEEAGDAEDLRPAVLAALVPDASPATARHAIPPRASAPRGPRVLTPEASRTTRAIADRHSTVDRAPGRSTMGPARFFPVVFGPRPAIVRPSPARVAATAPPTSRRGFAVPAVLGPTRPIPGAIGLRPGRPVGDPVGAALAPAPGRISVLSGPEPIAPAAGPAPRPPEPPAPPTTGRRAGRLERG